MQPSASPVSASRRVRALLGALAGLAVAAVATAPPAIATDSTPSSVRKYWSRLTPMQEVPAVSSTARGTIQIEVDAAAQTIKYELEYSGLEGTITMAHIHTAQAGVNGGIMLWLCGTATNPGPAAPNAPPVCPGPNGGTISGTLTAAQIQAVAAQGIAGPTEFAEVAAAIRNFVTYANVHSTKFPGGEARGQLVPRFGWRGDD
jgi:hypothetical protein